MNAPRSAWPTRIAAFGAAAALLLAAAPAAAEPDQEGDPDKVGPGQISGSVHGFSPPSTIHGIEPAEFIEELTEEDVRGDTTTVTISADVLFEFDKATLGKGAEKTLAGIADRLEGTSGTVEVVGHSDGIGEESYNQSLSEKRAGSVQKALEDALGSGAPEITASGKGSGDPIADEKTDKGDDDPAGRAKNRRVEISFQG
ncbi:outer membrane protein OmpA-like peptidoglycan-associated protein [Murinocardiopsis flavida]|uniref:Outer membrane protein OmpA-like peptidoglycan-associated protein n=1 Tax=Murinocardiopsis flavida TaxID=645275 RepID=A0A2P8DSI9_9ACTN|nr:OmpA family protein [Murinocardiopsis flavida]PSL00186.1 outer membrane protein OmpA-like peptidoglycan-associated protein [Murinocardiopsis flavida]